MKLEQPAGRGLLPAGRFDGRFDAVLRVERCVNAQGCVSVGGNYHSVPDGTRRRALQVQTTADQVCTGHDHRNLRSCSPQYAEKPKFCR